MVAIRLSRTGAKKRPSYRVVVIDSRRARDSRNIEIVGHYNPRPDPIEVVLKRDRIDYWVSVGAQLSDTVKRLVRHFDERVAGEAENGASAPVPTASDDAPEAVVEEAAAPSASAPGAPVPVAPGEEMDEDSDEVEALLELDEAAGPSPADEEPSAVADLPEAAVVEEAEEPAPESPEALSTEPEAVAEADPVIETDTAPVPEPEAAADPEPVPVPEFEAAAEAEPAPVPDAEPVSEADAAPEPEAAADPEPVPAPELEAAAEAAPAADPEPDSEETDDTIVEDADSESQTAEAKPE